MLVGLLVNPIAGMGGRVGLKGTDGVVDEAIKRGATPIAPGRAKEFLQTLDSLHIDPSRLELVVCPNQMGEDVTQSVGLSYTV
ncbi:MAG: ATP-NAD kinase family protein, partial [Candidatus Thorarchaeota archaeon]